MHAIVLTSDLFSLANILALVSGLCWLAVYVIAVKDGFGKKTYLIPMEALALNAVWEFLFGFIWSPDDPLLNGQAWVNAIWFGVDVLIILTVFLYATIPNVSRARVRDYFASLLVVAAGVLGSAYWVAAHAPVRADLAIIELQAVSSFLMNVLMSAPRASIIPCSSASWSWARALVGKR